MSNFSFIKELQTDLQVQKKLQEFCRNGAGIRNTSAHIDKDRESEVKNTRVQVKNECYCKNSRL